MTNQTPTLISLTGTYRTDLALSRAAGIRFISTPTRAELYTALDEADHVRSTIPLGIDFDQCEYSPDPFSPLGG